MYICCYWVGIHSLSIQFVTSGSLKFAKITPVRTPTFYGLLPKSRAIVMEDLRKYDRAPSFTLATGLQVIDSVALLHSHFRGANLQELAKQTSYKRQHVRRFYSEFRRRWSTTLSTDVWSLFDHAVEHYETAEKRLLEQPTTLLHGDLKFPNLFWDSTVKGGEPVFIDWQYAGPGDGIEDVVFLLVESCDITNFATLAEPLINAYYETRQQNEDAEIPNSERTIKVSCALAGFPLFVAVWFGCIDATQLSEPNFPFLYIIRLANAFLQKYDVNWVQTPT